MAARTKVRQVVRDAPRRVAGAALVMLVLAFTLYTYLDSRTAKRDLRQAAVELRLTRERLDRAAEAREVLTDEIRKLQGIISALGSTPPQFTFPVVPGPQGPQGPPGTSSGTTTTSRPSSAPTTSGTTSTTRPSTTSSTSTTSTTRGPIVTLTVPPL